MFTKLKVKKYLKTKEVFSLFDEPTSALDSESSQKVAELIKNLSKKDIGILIVTHDETFASNVATKIINLE